MKLPRPYIPVGIRLEAAWHQWLNMPARPDLPSNIFGNSGKAELNALLRALFGKAKVHLDHDPPLMLRVKVRRKSEKGKIIGYIPRANDPRFLVYRTADDHRIKTYVHGDGAQLSDMAQRRKNKRIILNRRDMAKELSHDLSCHVPPARKFRQRAKFKWPKRKIRSRPHV